MKLAILRNSMTGGKAAWMVTGAGTGVLIAVATIWFSFVDTGDPGAVPDILGAVYLSFLLGWMLGPLMSGSSVLRSEHFTLLPLPRRRLALGLVGAAFVGVGAVVTLLAFVSLVTYGARLGVLPALVALPAGALMLVMVVLVSRAAATLLGGLAKARTGAAMVGAFFGIVLVVTQSGWMALVGIIVSGVLDTGFPAGVSTMLRALPSGWGLVVVEAADDDNWLLVLGGLAAMAAFTGLVLLVWERTFGTVRTERVTIRGSRNARPPRRGLFATRTGAVVLKELRTWRRDPIRIQALVVPLVWAFGTALLPLTFGSTALLPWSAPALALMSGFAMVNCIGASGTALWQILQSGTEREDIRGRQVALLLVFAPVVTVSAVVFTALYAPGWAWPWVLSLTAALLGGSNGVVTWLSVVYLVPGPDPHKLPGNQMEHADVTGPSYALFGLGVLPALPPLGVLIPGAVTGNDVLLWSGVPIGVATGAFLAWWLGRVAHRRLCARGPELLAAMRSSRRSQAAADILENYTYSRRKKIAAVVGWIVGPLATFPQGLVPMVFLLADLDDKSWFLALYLPQALRWPVAVAMFVVGVCFFYVAIKASMPDRKEPGPDDDIDDDAEAGELEPAAR